MSSNSDALLRVSVEGNSTTVLFPTGTILNEDSVGEIGKELTTLIDNRTCRDLALDLRGVTLLSSVALAMLIGVNAKLREKGGRLKLIEPIPAIREVFRMTRLDTVFEICSAHGVSAA